MCYRSCINYFSNNGDLTAVVYVWIISITCHWPNSHNAPRTKHIRVHVDVFVCVWAPFYNQFTVYWVPTQIRASFFILFVVPWHFAFVWVELSCDVYGCGCFLFVVCICNKVDLCKHILWYENQSWNIWSEWNLSTIIEGTIHTFATTAGELEVNHTMFSFLSMITGASLGVFSHFTFLFVKASWLLLVLWAFCATKVEIANYCLQQLLLEQQRKLTSYLLAKQKTWKFSDDPCSDCVICSRYIF